MAKHLTSAQLAEAISLFMAGDPMTSIAARYGYTESSLRTRLRREGFKRKNTQRPYRIHLLSEMVFDGELTPEHRYWIGMLHADGYVNGRGKVSLQLSGEDGSLVHGLASFIGYTGPLVTINATPFVSPNGKTYISTEATRLTVQSVSMANTLIRMGIVAKAKAIYEPLRGDPDYMRGMFDGNGSIYQQANSRWRWSYTGGLPACEMFAHKVRELGGSATIRSCKGCYECLVYSSETILAIQKYMYYNGCSPVLHRKAVVAPISARLEEASTRTPISCCTSWDSSNNRWEVRVTENGRNRRIGRFRTRAQAYSAYAKDSLRIYGKDSPYYKMYSKKEKRNVL